jgi:hypothetical protein
MISTSSSGKPTHAKAVIDAPAAVSAVVVQLVVVVAIAVEVVVVVLAGPAFTASQSSLSRRWHS